MEPEMFKEIRKKVGLTQCELGEILGVTQSSVYLYERGYRKISDDIVIKMADIDRYMEPKVKSKPGKKAQLSFGMQSVSLVHKVKELQGNRTNREFLESICL